jgi:hypothetical protein
VDGWTLISFRFPVAISVWATSNKRYWVTLAKRRSLALFLDFDLRRLILHSSSVKRSSSIRSFPCREMRSPCSPCSCCQQCRQIRRVDSGKTASSVPIDYTAAACEWSPQKGVSPDQAVKACPAEIIRYSMERPRTPEHASTSKISSGLISIDQRILVHSETNSLRESPLFHQFSAW